MVYVLIVGGGKVGLHLARTLRHAGHEVTLLERRQARLEVLRRDLGEVAVQGDGALPSILEAAGCARADVVAAVTGDDATNLLVSVLAVRHFAAERCIARLNDPRNERLFRRLGVRAVVSSSLILAELVEREVAAAQVRTLLAFPGGGVAIVQVDLTARSPAAGTAVRDVPWPARTLLCLVLRGHDVLIPQAATELAPEDRLVLVAPPEAEAALQALLAPDTA